MTQRLVSASQTLLNIKDNVKQAGISRIADLSYLDDLTNLKVYSAIRPNSKSLCVSMGKGVDIDSAKVGAYMESIESFYAENIPDSSNIASYSQLHSNNQRHIKIEDYLNVLSVSPDYQLKWYQGCSLLNSAEILIPKPLLSLDSNDFDNFIFGANSNALASGNSIEEAITYSFLEFVERSSEKINQVFPIYMPNLSIKDITISDELDIKLFLISNQYQLPVILALVQDKHPLFNKIVYKGTCCHFNKDIAIRGAVFEALQSRIGIISGARDDLRLEHYKQSFNEAKTQDINEIGYNDIPSVTIDAKGQLNYIKDLLISHHKDLLYYVYHSSKVSVVKTFLI